MDNCKLLIDLCCNKLDEDNIIMLDLLAMVLNPHSKYVILPFLSVTQYYFTKCCINDGCVLSL